MFPAAASSPFPRSRPSGPSHLSPSCARLCFHVSDRSCARPHHPTTGNAQLSSSSNSCPRDLLPASASKIPLSLVPLVWTMSQDGSQHRHHHPHYYHHLSQRRPNSLTRQSLVKHSSSGSVLSSSQSQVAVTSSSLNRKGGGGGELVASKSTSSLSTRRHAESAEVSQMINIHTQHTCSSHTHTRTLLSLERKKEYHICL